MCCRGRHCGAACVVVSQWLAQHFATCRCFRSLSREEAGSHDSIMAMEEGQTIAEAGKLDKFPHKASTAAASRWSGKPRPQGGPCRQIWRHRPDCHCNRQGMLERFLCKAIVAASSRRRGPCRQIWDCHRHRQGMLEKFEFVKQSLLPLQGGVSHVGRSFCTARTAHAGSSGCTTRIVTATGKASLNAFFVKQSLLPLEGGVAHAGRSGIVIATGKASLSSFFVRQSLLLLQGGVSHVGTSGRTARIVHAGRSGRTTRIVTATGKASLDILHTVFVRRCCRSAPTRWPWSLQCRGWPCRWTGFPCRRQGKHV